MAEARKSPIVKKMRKDPDEVRWPDPVDRHGRHRVQPAYKAELAKALAESRAAEAQKDSLLTEVLETTQFVSDLNSELAKAKTVAVASGERRPRASGRDP